MRPQDDLLVPPVRPLRKVDGRYVQIGGEASDESAVDGLEPVQTYGCRHKRLEGQMRCEGCGRTKNEIVLEEA